MFFCFLHWVFYVAQEQVDQGIANDGSNLSGVSGRCSWEDASLESALHLRSGGHVDDGDDNKENSISSKEAGRRESAEAARRQLSNYGTWKFFWLDYLFVNSSKLHNKLLVFQVFLHSSLCYLIFVTPTLLYYLSDSVFVCLLHALWGLMVLLILHSFRILL